MWCEAEFDDFFPQHLRLKGLLLKNKNLKYLRDLTGDNKNQKSCTGESTRKELR